MKSWLFALLLFVAALLLFTRQQGFPWFYHPDEPGKVEQVITGQWNFHHPMLMLQTAKLAAGSKAVAGNEQAVVETGRTVSAVFAAMAVALLSVAAWRVAGSVAGVFTGLLLLTHHQLFELAHYFKEDTSLLVGVAAVLCALAGYRRKNGEERECSVLPALWIGAACGLAVSGKYLGAVLLIPAAVVVWGSRAGRWKRFGMLLASFVAVLLFVNAPMLLDGTTFRNSFEREVEFVVKGQKGMTQRVPHTEYLSAFRDNSTPMLWLGLAWAIVAFWKRRLPRSAVMWVLLLFPFVFTLALSFSPKTNDRYFLPATAGFTLLAGIGLAQIQNRTGRYTAISLAVAAQCVSLPDPLDWKNLLGYHAAFRHDDRADLRAWVGENIPPDGIIVQDSRAGLPVTGRERDAVRQKPLPQTVFGKKFAAEVGTLEELREKGVACIVVSESDYGRYFRSRLKPKQGYEDEFTRHRNFYERLFKEGEKVWSRPRGIVIYLHPGIEVYRLKKP